jgi:hypothetical protein
LSQPEVTKGARVEEVSGSAPEEMKMNGGVGLQKLLDERETSVAFWDMREHAATHPSTTKAAHTPSLKNANQEPEIEDDSHVD